MTKQLLVSLYTDYKKMEIKYKNDFTCFLFRIFWLYVIYGLCRVLFWIVNKSLIDPVNATDLWGIIKGSLIFDSVSIFYINIPFLLLSLIPLRIREKEGYRKILFWLFIITNSLALALNVTDAFFYEFKHGRIAADDLIYLEQKNIGYLLGSFLRDFWYGFLLYIIIVLLLVWGYKKITYHPMRSMNKAKFFILNTAVCLLCLTTAIYLIRGCTFSLSTFPISMSDTRIYVKNPSHASLILSNPFCLIRSSENKFDRYELYFDPQNAEELYPTTKQVDFSFERPYKIDSTTNVVLIVLESFGSTFISSLNGGKTNLTPFLDSICNKGLFMRNAFHNGIRTIDVLPSIWTSLPSFKAHFLTTPHSVASMQGLPEMLSEMGYHTSFFHGAEKHSMSLVAFANSCNIDETFSREEYEEERGKGDFDGYWGIFDDKLLGYAADKISQQKQPFFSTILTLSSHTPYSIPKEFQTTIPKNIDPMNRCVTYTDRALRDFFNQLSQQDFFTNTLFIITADHGYMADNEKFLKVPFSFSVPILFYKPESNIKGYYDQVASHIDIMPTLLGMLGYKKNYFAFGRDLQKKEDNVQAFTINYFGGAYNIITDSTTYLFDEKSIISTIGTTKSPIQPNTYDRARAFIQQYNTHLTQRSYLP